MLTKLPRWIWAAGWVLAFMAGIINVVGLLSFEHQAVTHLTGTTSMLGAALSAGDHAAAEHFAAIIGAFLLGTMVSGFVVQESALQLGLRYGVALLLEALLLLSVAPLLQHESRWGLYAAAAACGLQNAMVSTYSGTVVRTTHISGMLTDLGIFLGHALRGRPVDHRRLRLCFLIISGFLAGGMGGAAIFPRLGYATLRVPAALAGFAALWHSFTFLRRASALRVKPGGVP